MTARVSRDIFSGLSPFTGTAAAPGNFGISGPNVPSVSWAPTGAPDESGLGAIARFLNSGKPPKSHGSISLKGFDFVQYVYLCPPWADNSQRYIMPEMLAWTVNTMDTGDSATTVLTLPKINQIAKDCYDEFKRITDERPGNSDASPEAIEFKKFLVLYGEHSLETFAKLRDLTTTTVMDAAERKDMIKFLGLAKQDFYCWLTRFGIMSRVTYVGPVINVNRAVSVEELDMTQHADHYCQVNVCYAKRGRIANVFGPACSITTGSKLWLTLRRKMVLTHEGMEPRHYQIVPGGSTLRDKPSDRERTYLDDSGRPVLGHVWRVGVVSFPGPSSPSVGSCQDASNTGVRCSEREAYEAHGTLPSLIVAVGFTQ